MLVVRVVAPFRSRFRAKLGVEHRVMLGIAPRAKDLGGLFLLFRSGVFSLVHFDPPFCNVKCRFPKKRLPVIILSYFLENASDVV